MIYSQIPINGFCIQNSFHIPPGYEKILSADLNKDQIDEFIVYSSSFKKIGIISFVNDRAIDFKEFPVTYEFSQIKYLNDKSSSNRFICVSRKNRLIAVYEFGISSMPELKSKITFDSYPENISLGDINNDGFFEIMVSGIGFDGLSILIRKEGRLAETKIISGESFNQAVFADLSNDGYVDVTAFNVINNSNQFFYNDTKSKFRLVRDSRADEKIEFLNVFDFNNDEFHDLYFNYGTSLNVVYGDFQSTYEKKKSIQLKNKPFALQIGDYNDDGFTDIAYINSENGKVNILFGKYGTGFYDEITYTKLSSVSCIAGFNQKGKNNLIILSKDGYVTTISSIKNDFKIGDIVPSVKAGVIQKFDLNKDGTSDIGFMDGSDNSFRILTRSDNGIPTNYYSHQLDEPHQSIVIDDFFKVRKTFYFYSKEKQLIEFLRINFKTNKINHKHLYSPGKIKDFAIQRLDSSLVNIYLLYEKGNKLFLGKFEHKDLSLTFKEYPFIDRDVICAKLFLDKDIQTYYWKAKSDSVFYNNVIVKTGPNIYRGIVGLSKGDSIKISLFASNQLFNGKPWLISAIKNGDENFIISFKENVYKKLQPLTEEFELTYSKVEQFVFTKLQNDENETPFIYLPESKTLNKLIISKDGKTYSLKQITSEVDINNYFIDKFNATNYHLVYSNKKKGCISIVRLKKW